MGEELKEKNFFKKVWTSIKDFEGYESFAAEKVWKAIKYILLLTLIFTIFIVSAYTYKFYLSVDNVREYIYQNVEDINLKSGKLEVIAEDKIIFEDENNIIPIIIVDTKEDANKEESLEKIKAYNTGILCLSDKMIIESKLLNKQEEIYYSNIFSFDITGKANFLNMIGGRNLFYTNLAFFATLLIYLFIVYLSSNIIDVVVLGVIGYLFGRIVKIRLRYKATFNIGVHALTLPLILNLIYIIVNLFTGFEIRHFQWMYTSISYIYVVVAILMIKTEIINQKIQLIKLREIQANEAKKAEENEETSEENPKEENKEKEEKKEEADGEPEGSNA